jgi:hypothetical protein
VVYRVPLPAPYVPYLTLGVGWGPVEIGTSGPKRQIPCERPSNGSDPKHVEPCFAQLFVHRRTPQELTLRIRARAIGTSARVLVSAEGADRRKLVDLVDMVSTAETFEFRLSGDAEVVNLDISAPVVIESLELVVPY